MFDYFYWFDKEFNSDSCSKRYSYKHISQDNKELLAVNVAGFAEDDLKLEVKSFGNKDYLYITGTPKDNVKDFVEPINIRFAIQSDLVDEIERETRDGMLYITVSRKETKPQIKIKIKK